MKQIQKMYSCAVHKHGKTNKQKDRVPTEEANPRPGWTCHQGGFSWMALGPEPLGWAQEQQARASLRSAPGWLGSLCPRFLGRQSLRMAQTNGKTIQNTTVSQSPHSEMESLCVAHLLPLIPCGGGRRVRSSGSYSAI